jgi:hypothetical protein
MEATMKKLLIIAGGLTMLGAAPQPAAAQAGGCIKYGIGGAIIGKLAGGHTWKGAAAGCVVGYLRRRQARNEITERERDVLARHERQLERERSARRDPDFRGRGNRDRYDEPPETGSFARPYNGL